MILFALPPHTVETVPAWDGAPLRSWRWAVVADRWSVVLQEQVLFADWSDANRYLGAYLCPVPARWHFGFHHVYYDGPHHILWLGFFHLAWMRDAHCPTCEGQREDTSGAVAAFVEAVLGAAMEVV